MKISKYGLALIMAFEGCHRAVKGRPGFFKAYKDPVGVLTIGWGHTNHHTPTFNVNTIWSQEQCDKVLEKDLEIFERHVKRLSRVKLKQHEFDALVSWAYNTGGPASASVWKMLNSGNKESVPARLALYNKGEVNGVKVVLPGLARRRKAEGELFRGEIAKAMQTAGAKIPKEVKKELEEPPIDYPLPEEYPEPQLKKPGLFRRILNWLGVGGIGGGTGVFGFLEEPVIMAGIVVFIIVIIAGTLWFIGADGRASVRAWIKRQFV